MLKFEAQGPQKPRVSYNWSSGIIEGFAELDGFAADHYLFPHLVSNYSMRMRIRCVVFVVLLRYVRAPLWSIGRMGRKLFTAYMTRSPSGVKT